LVNTHVPRSTKQLVAGVRELHTQYTGSVSAMLHAMGELAKQFRQDATTCNGETKTDLLYLVETNQHLLRAVGVSHPSLDYICETVRRVAPGQAAAKLTGAGGGGCAMVLLRPDTSTSTATETVERIQKALQETEEWKFELCSSVVGGEGVLWVAPSEFPDC
jgi:mevalonate kinase